MSTQPQPSWRAEVRAEFDRLYPDLEALNGEESRRAMAVRLASHTYSDDTEHEVRHEGLMKLVKDWTPSGKRTGLRKAEETGERVVVPFVQLTLDDLLEDVALRRAQLAGDQFELDVRLEIVAAMRAKGASGESAIGDVLTSDEVADIRIAVAERFRGAA